MNVKEIVSKYLFENGFDGLTDENECGCNMEDLMPCDSDCWTCVAAYKVKPDKQYIEENGECEWVMSTKKEAGV